MTRSGSKDKHDEHDERLADDGQGRRAADQRRPARRPADRPGRHPGASFLSRVANVRDTVAHCLSDRVRALPPWSPRLSSATMKKEAFDAVEEDRDV